MKKLVALFACWLLALALIVAPGTVVQAEVFRQLYHTSALAAPGANTDAMPDLTWEGRWGEILRITVQCETATVVNLMIDDGTNEIDSGLNSNTALVAGATYTFDVTVQPGWVINLQSETDTVWDTITVGHVR